ncbi:uncharacterized protein LOC141844473 [Curcuma longa]|uniref:uncharacterized protein LOC141844473 n=1 Tax=Curcuma longa TaxID=136217 RepID=UPI003D9F429D
MAFGPLPPALTRLLFPPSRRLPSVFGGRRISSTAYRPDKDIPPSSSSPPSVSASRSEAEAEARRREAYRQLDDLDFMTAAKILFTTPPKRKEFGFDFHLVQFFFACLPSLAVFLVAQYARYEIRRMEAELEEKKKKEEEEQKEKEIELGNNEEQPEAELSKVIARLDALEETVKVIASEKAKVPSSLSSKDRQVDPKGQVVAADKQFDTQSSLSSKDQQVDPKGLVVAADKQFDTQNQTKAGEYTTISKKEQVSGSGHSSYIAELDKEGKGTVGATSGKSTN